MAVQLAPCFLLASPSLRSPDFKQTVVLLVEHSSEGSLGFIVNRRAAIGFRRVLGQVGIEVGEDDPVEMSVLAGGPVQPGSGWLLFEQRASEEPPEESVVIGHSLAISASLKLLEALAQGRGPTRGVMLLGYAGWGPGQLEEEIRAGAWLHTSLNGALVFDTALEDRWHRAYSALGIEPGQALFHVVPQA
ncbi:MAG: YqgE/AlgH family protein [Polyangiales bacterium]